MKLKELRLKINKTQEEVAQDLKLKKQTYQNYELQKREPDIQTLIQLADYYNVSVDKLLNRKTNGVDTSSFSDTKKGCVFVVDKLNEANATILLGYATRLLQEQNNKHSNKKD